MMPTLPELRATFYTHATPYNLALLAIAGAFTAFLISWWFFVAPVFRFPESTYVHVEEGSSVREVAAMLKERGIIRSETALVALNRLLGNKAVAGEYFFPRAQNAIVVARRLATGDHDITAVRVTLPEGASIAEMAQILGERVPDFDTALFIRLAEGDEGRLFPDTYFIFPGERADTVHKMLRENFDQQILDEDVVAAIEESGKTLEELLVMASILEKEASRMQDRRTIAGILWERIDRGMPLQVDAVFPYIIGKNTFELTLEDLKVDSPYNTYANKGLPPGPIGNPGLNSILAAATPIASEYLFFLSDYSGDFHFSRTYEQHLNYKRQYLGS
jgi:UPF0755 protein